MFARHRKKGRKIYTYRAKNRRMFHHSHPVRTAAGILVTMLIAAVLGIVGYSVIGPLTARLSAEKEHPTQTDEPYFTDSADSQVSGTDLTAETTSLAVQSSTTSSMTTEETETTAEITETTTLPMKPVQKYPADMTVSRFLTEQTVSEQKLLQSAAEMYAEKGYSELLLPLKLSGGKLMYRSDVKAAVKSGASAESPDLSEIVNTVRSCGLQCAASIDLLDDQTYPSYYAEGAYQITDNRGRWLDRAESDGGKPWISPFTNAARKYLADIAKELADGGCQSVICSGLVFPKFRKSDVELVGKKVTDAEKQKSALTETLNQISQAVPSAAVSLSLADAVYNQIPVSLDDSLQNQTVFFIIEPDAFRSSFNIDGKQYRPSGLSQTDKLHLLLDAAANIADGREVIPCLKLSSAPDSDVDALVLAAYDSGIRHLVILAA